MKLHRGELDAELLALPAQELHAALGGPALLRLQGQAEPALFLSVLLHGNEPVGWEALRELLRQRSAVGAALPRSIEVFVGNVMAAREGLRRLDGQPDYNRIWKGGSGPEAELARELLAEMRRRPPWLAIDVHNNTGVNPHYACITRLDPVSLALARQFARPVVYVRSPDTVLAAALAPMAPAVILEAGRPHERRGVEHVMAYLNQCLQLSALPTRPEPDAPDLFETVATVRVPAGMNFDFCVTEPAALERDLYLLEAFEHYNFEELPAGTLFGYQRPGPVPLEVTDVADHDVTTDYFETRGAELRLRRDLVPAMFSPDPRIIRQDVVCYLMERVPLH